MLPHTLTVRVLGADDDRRGFNSGDPSLDHFFHLYAGQNQFKHHIGTTYIACDTGLSDTENGILGFITVTAGHIEIDALPVEQQRKLPHYPLPVLRLARLAVDQTHQGRGLGGLLLRSAFDIANTMAKTVGCVGIVVDAKENATSFYTPYGFVPFAALSGGLQAPGRPTPMFLPRRLFAPSSS